MNNTKIVLIISLILPIFLQACGKTKECSELEKRYNSLEEEVKRLRLENSETHKTLSALQETDQAYWARALDEKKRQNWAETISITNVLLERWPTSSLSGEARKLRDEARTTQAASLLLKANSELEAGSSSAISTLRSLVNDYPDTPAGKSALKKLKPAEEELERRAIGTGKWSVSTEVSPIDDSSNVFMSLESNESIKTGLGAATPTLTLRCKEKTTNAYINWGVYLGIDETDVLIRLDDARSTESSWSISTDYKAAFVSGSDAAFIKKLIGHKKLLARVTPYGESPATVTFDIAGLSEAVKPLRKACGW